MNKYIHKLYIKDDTSENDMRLFFDKAYSMKKKCIFVFYIRNINNHVNKLWKLKDLLENHRENTKRYLIKSIIYISNLYIKKILEIFFYLIKSEKPIIFKIYNFKN